KVIFCVQGVIRLRLPSPLSKISSCPQGSRQGFVDRVSVYGVIMSISSTQPLSGSEEWPHQCASQPIVSGHHHLAEHRFEPSDPPTSPSCRRWLGQSGTRTLAPAPTRALADLGSQGLREASRGGFLSGCRCPVFCQAAQSV